MPRQGLQRKPSPITNTKWTTGHRQMWTKNAQTLPHNTDTNKCRPGKGMFHSKNSSSSCWYSRVMRFGENGRADTRKYFHVCCQICSLVDSGGNPALGVGWRHAQNEVPENCKASAKDKGTMFKNYLNLLLCVAVISCSFLSIVKRAHDDEHARSQKRHSFQFWILSCWSKIAALYS